MTPVKRTLLLFLPILFLALTQQASAQCAAGQNSIRLVIDPDQYFYEVTWEIANSSGNEVYATGTCANTQLATFNYCAPQGVCTVFRIRDSYGDGMTPDGYYQLYVNDVLIHENIGGAYSTIEETYFDCPPGTSCNTALQVDTGFHTSPPLPEIWFSFTPADTGTYKLNTCQPGNDCPSKIWVYDACSGITVTNNQTGAIFYADGGCTGGAEATMYFAGGVEYFIRLRFEGNNCLGDSLHFTLNYAGPVVGCTDPNACNYNPLASVSDTCIYPGNPNCPNAPDLVVLQNVLRNSMVLDFIANADACAVEEGCLRGVGNRYIIRFTTHIKNTGNQDYYIGETPPTPSTPSDQFMWDPCHNHWHYRGYADYILFDEQGNQVPIGSKNGFCVLDLECSDGGNAQYGCNNMGISADCGDIYDSSLPCQWVDITDLPAGQYQLVMRVNWDQSPDKAGRQESSYDNNWAQGCFQLSYSGNTPVVDFLDDDCPVYTDCLGVQLGDAQMDCEGVCNGTAVRGDLNGNLVRENTDRAVYINEALAGNTPASSCSDLYTDGVHDVYDAALLQECYLHENDPDHWQLRFPCQFPTGFANDDDLVFLLPGELDTVAKTFDVLIVNPYNKLYGYEFKVSGLDIASVENLAAGFDAPVAFNTSGKLLALTESEMPVSKNILPTPLLRVHYNALTDVKVCIESIQAVVNEHYQRSTAALADPNCVQIVTTSSQEPGKNEMTYFVQPNPFTESTSIFFANPENEPVHAVLTDVQGRTVRNIDGLRGETWTITRGNLPAGVYFFQLRGAHGYASGKLIVE